MQARKSIRRQILQTSQALGETLKRLDSSLRYRRKVRRIRSGLASKPTWPAGELQHARAALSKFNRGYRCLDWHLAYSSVNQIRSPYYIPEDLFYSAIERLLNPRARLGLYRNKNLYGLLGIRSPEVVARFIRGRLIDDKFRPTREADVLSRVRSTEVVVKPALDSGLGRNVTFVPSDELARFLADLVSNGSQDLVIEAPIKQSPFMSAFNSTSVNTLRIMTFREENEIIHISSVLRVGRKGRRIDNQGAGGLACGIDENGRLRSFAVDKFLNRYSSHPDTRLSFARGIVPAYRDAVELCLSEHIRFPDMDLISWDIALDPQDRPVIIEMNVVGQEINFHQACNGAVFANSYSSLANSCRIRTLFAVPF